MNIIIIIISSSSSSTSSSKLKEQVSNALLNGVIF